MLYVLSPIKHSHLLAGSTTLSKAKSIKTKKKPQHIQWPMGILVRKETTRRRVQRRKPIKGTETSLPTEAEFAKSGVALWLMTSPTASAKTSTNSTAIFSSDIHISSLWITITAREMLIYSWLYCSLYRIPASLSLFESWSPLIDIYYKLLICHGDNQRRVQKWPLDSSKGHPTFLSQTVKPIYK